MKTFENFLEQNSSKKAFWNGENTGQNDVPYLENFWKERVWGYT